MPNYQTNCLFGSPKRQTQVAPAVFTKSTLNVTGTISSPPAPGTPGQVTGVVATAGTESAVLLFASPSSNGGSPLTSYTSTASPGGSTATILATTSPVAGLSCRILHPGLTPGTSYTFTVVANNANGPGATPSIASNAVTPIAAAPYYVACGSGVNQENSQWNDAYSYSLNALAYQAQGSTFNGYTVPAPLTSGTDVLCVNYKQYGGWQPHIINSTLGSGTNGRFNLNPYSKITISIYPTQSGMTVSLDFLASLWWNYRATGATGATVTEANQDWTSNQWTPYSFDDLTTAINQTGISGNTATILTYKSSGAQIGDYFELQQPDVNYGQGVTLPNSAYGPSVMTANEWNTYTIPLTAFDSGTSLVHNLEMLKFGAQSNLATTAFFCNVGFLP